MFVIRRRYQVICAFHTKPRSLESRHRLFRLRAAVVRYIGQSLLPVLSRANELRDYSTSSGGLDVTHYAICFNVCARFNYAAL